MRFRLYASTGQFFSFSESPKTYIIFLFSYSLRKLHGCSELQLDAQLAKQAQAHAEYLAKKRRMVHSLALDYGENIAKKVGTSGFTFTGKSNNSTIDRQLIVS